MARVLEIVTALNQGGVDRIIYDYSTRFSASTTVDFVVTDKEGGLLENDLLSKGFRVYHISKMREGIFKHCKELGTIIKQGKYDVVHDNSGYKGVFNLLVAKTHHVRIRIEHSHFANVPESFFQRLIRWLCTILCRRFATHLFACGKDAAKWMWGDSSYRKGKVKILKNAISTRDFMFDEARRHEYRKQLGVEDSFCLGCVARFRPQKNHEFLIRVFDEVLSLVPDTKLVLIGEGDTKESIIEYCSEKGIADKVIFLGVRNDVGKILNAFDVFLLPSRFEGLPIVLVEAQCNGLPIFASDKITDEIKLLETTRFLSLSSSPTEWAKEIVCYYGKTVSRDVSIDYDIDREAERFETFLIEETSKRERKRKNNNCN